MQIKLINNQSEVEFDFETIEEYSICISNKFDINNNRSMNIIFVASNEVQKLNKSYRNIDRPTDVLSFSYLAGTEDAGDDPVIIGEIYISLEMALKNLKEQGEDWSIDQEIMLLIIHGMLHIFGYDHEEDEEEKAGMYGIQDSMVHHLWNKKENRY